MDQIFSDLEMFQANSKDTNYGRQGVFESINRHLILSIHL